MNFLIQNRKNSNDEISATKGIWVVVRIDGKVISQH